jgi:Penicillin V acylase and related amidases
MLILPEITKFMKKFLLWLIALLIVLAAAVAIIWGKEIRTLSSLHSIGDNPYLYEMEYKAAYDLDDMIAKEVDTNAELLNYVVGRIGKGIPIKMKSSQVADENGHVEAINCTSFQARNAEGEGYLFGRNYDYFKNPTLVTVSRPKKGYASIAVTDMSHVGYGLEKLPTSFMKKVNALAAIYAPVDGINEKGVCMSIMALPKQASQQDTPKPDVGTTAIIRLVLDRCATVQEALDLIATVDVRHDATVGSGYHYMIADAQGDCAVVEFDREDGWKTMVVRKPAGQNAFAVTNHLLSPKYYTTEPDIYVGNPNSHSWMRYEKICAFLDGHNGILTTEQAQEGLAKVRWVDLALPNGRVEDTQYSNVYDQSALTLRLRNWNDYDTVCKFSLK